MDVVCSDGDACCLLRWVRCVFDRFDRFALMWVWFALIGVSWVKWWRGFGSVVAGGFGSVLCMWIGAVGLDRCRGFGSVLLLSCLVIVVVGGSFWQFFVFVFLLVVVSYGLIGQKRIDPL